MIVNLTPHALDLVDADGAVLASVPSSGVARARVSTETLGEVEVAPSVTVPLVRSVYGEPVDLPAPESGTYLVVSLITAQSAAATGRTTTDLLLTQDLVRDGQGRVVGARALSPYGA